MPLTRFTFRQFEALAAVAETRSFTAAGMQLGLSSSAVSQLIADLEATLGFKLFDRSTRRVELSSPGLDFLGSAHSVLRHIQMADTAASDIRNRASGIVRIGAPMVLAGAVLPWAIREFTGTRPKVVIRIRDTKVEDLVDRVVAGDLDLALGPDRSGEQNVLVTPVFDSPWVLWCAPTHPLAARRTLQWSDLRSVHLVAAGRDHERSVAQMHANAPEGARISAVDVVDNISTALGIAAQGLAATLAPAYVGAVAVPLGLVKRRVTKPETIRQVCIYRPARRAAPPAAEAFHDFLLGWLGEWSRGQHATRRPPGAPPAAGG